MDKKSDLKKGKYHSSIMLLTVLIGFCILAIIEILYGQAQIRMERERLALEEENNQTVQELKAEWNNLKGDPNVGTQSAETVGVEQHDSAEPEKTLINTGESASDSSSVQDTENGGEEPVEDDREYAMQIVFMGDSILDFEGEDGGVTGMVGDALNAKVYNMAIGGTTAALMPNEQYNFAEWNSISLLGVVNAILGNINPDIFDGYEAGEVLKQCDFSKTDYFVIEYGINDFLSRQIPQSRYLEGGDVLAVDASHTYAGALEIAVSQLEGSFPNAKILLVGPHYCEIFEAGTFMGDAYSLNYGYGTLVEFLRCAGYVAEQHKGEATIFFNAMDQSGIDAYTANKYLEDGVHLSNEGRRVYADWIINRLYSDFYPQE